MDKLENLLEQFKIKKIEITLIPNDIYEEPKIYISLDAIVIKLSSLELKNFLVRKQSQKLNTMINLIILKFI